MIDLTKINDIIAALPVLIIYILPGYCFISLKDFITNIKPTEDKNIVIKSILISYVIINISRLIFNILRLNFDISLPIVSLFIITLAIIITYLYSIFVQSEKCDKILKWFKVTRSIKSDALTDIIDLELGMWVRVFLNSEQIIYMGKIRKFHHFGDSNYYIILSNYSQYNYSGLELINRETLNTEWVAISLKENYRIELSYNPASKKII